MNSNFTSEFFAANRARLRDLFTGTAPIVLTANGLLQRGADSTYPFQQDATFWYFTGCDDPDVTVVLDKDKDYLIVPVREGARATFDGTIDETELIRITGIDTVLHEAEGWKQLSGRLRKVKHVATLPASPKYIEHYGMYTNPARRQLIQKMKAENSSLELLDISQHVARMRMVKQAPEIAALQQSIDITMDSLKDSLRPAKRSKYIYEYEIEAELTRGFRSRGARGHSFEPIVASGKRACVLHNVANNGALAADELLICDVGAEYQHYAADITRTVALGNPSRRQEAVFEAVLEVQAYAISLLIPGVLLKAYEQQVEHYMGEKLRELGLIKTIDHDTVRAYYPHATSHFLGLNVHDVGDYDRPMEPGVVLTIEPGIYIPEEGIGVRIEDDAVIMEDGVRILSERLPRSLG
ncbi:MAG: aminopeptidase P family protein [Candidatus Saccharimonadales bacterium]